MYYIDSIDLPETTVPLMAAVTKLITPGSPFSFFFFLLFLRRGEPIPNGLAYMDSRY